MKKRDNENKELKGVNCSHSLTKSADNARGVARAQHVMVKGVRIS